MALSCSALIVDRKENTQDIGVEEGLKTATKREVKSGGRSPQMKFHVENKKFRLYSS